MATRTRTVLSLTAIWCHAIPRVCPVSSIGHAAAEGVHDERAYTLLLIGYKAETSIADATRALVERPSLAQRVIDEDDEVDRLELEIDDMSDSYH